MDQLVRHAARVALVVVVIASALALVPQQAGAADPSRISWTGAAGDRLWSTPGNWRADDGTVRLPGPRDAVSIGDSATTEAVVDQPFTVAAVGAGGSTRLTVASALTVTGRLGASDLTIRPGAALVADTYWLGRPTVTAGGRATIRATTGIHTEDLRVAGEVLIDSPATQLAATTEVHDGGRLLFTGPVGTFPSGTVKYLTGVGVTGHLLLHGTGTVTNTTPLEFYGGERSSLSGTPPTFHGISLVHTGAWEVRVNNGSDVGIVYERSTVRVVPNVPATTPVHEAAVGEVRPGGRLILDGTIDDPVRLEKDARLVNAGEVVADHAVIQQSMENTGLVRAGADTVWVTPAPEFGQPYRPHINQGTIRVGGPPDPGEARAVLALAGETRNHGQILGGDNRPGRVDLHDVRMTGAGPIRVPLRFVKASGLETGADSDTRVSDLDVNGGYVTSWAAGHVAERNRAVRSDGTVRLGPESHLSFARDTWLFHPCRGDRIPVLSWQRLEMPDGPPIQTPANGADDQTRLLIRDRQAEVIVDSWLTEPSVCNLLLGPRATNAIAVEGLDRSLPKAQVDALAPHARNRISRRNVAALVLGSTEGVRNSVDSEYRRVLGRPASGTWWSQWTSRLQSGTAPDELRASLHGSGEAWTRAGGSTDRWIDQLYRTELGRSADPAGREAIRRSLGAGASRTDVARVLLASTEADRALARRLIVQWWTRPPTSSELAVWGTRIHTGSEVTMRNAIAADLPVG